MHPGLARSVIVCLFAPALLLATEPQARAATAAAGSPAFVDKSTWSDFDGNGWADLAIGVPNETIAPGGIRGGAVHVLYGFEDGLQTASTDFWHQDVDGIANKVEAYDRFGASLATGDFDSDGYGDLAIGVPNEDLLKDGLQVKDAGMVHVLHGSPSGLTAAGSHVRRGIDENDGPGAQFGYALASGDLFDPDTTDPELTRPYGFDGFADLVVGAPGPRMLHYYSGQDFSSANDVTFDYDFRGSRISGERDGFGSIIVVGDFNDEPGEAVAIGLPISDFGGGTDCGNLWIQSALSGHRALQGLGGVDGSPEDSDRFASSLAAADLNGDGWDELIVGVPREDVSGQIDAGVFHVLWTNANGTGFASGPWYSQSVAGARSRQAINSAGRSWAAPSTQILRTRCTSPSVPRVRIVARR